MGYRAGTREERRRSEDHGEGVSGNVGQTPELEENDDCQHTHQSGLELLESTPPITTNATTTTTRDPMESTDSRICNNFSREPPVTKSTLSELDVPRIVFNPKLRHDVNFDPDLHFRPNLDGEKGRRKTQKADEFWSCLREQLDSYMKDQTTFIKVLGNRQWCLPLTLRAIVEILATLVPPEERRLVEEILDVDLLMQQLSKGVADLEKLALWLSRTLKSHCAPMRDDWVDKMVRQLSSGNMNGDVDQLVQGLRTLLGILEAMKLDVANHQIRCLRPLLIQDTVEFEQTFFVKKLALGKIDIAAAHNFFHSARSLHDGSTPHSRNSRADITVFFRAFINLLLPSNTTPKVPDTFMFDEERISKLRSEILDPINLDVCTRFFHDESRKFHGRSSSPSTPISGYESSRSASPTFGSRASSPMMYPVPDFQATFRRKQQFNAPQYSQTSLSDDSSCILDYDNTNVQRHSLPTQSSNITTRPTMFHSQGVTSVDIPQRSSPNSELSSEYSLRQAILALVDDSPGEDRWQKGCSAIALQILRSKNCLNDLSNFEDNLRRFENKLKSYLSQPSEEYFRTSESRISSELCLLVDDLVVHYTRLTSTQLFDIASNPRPPPTRSEPPGNTLLKVAKEIAHIGVLHWRVWAPLTYLIDFELEGSAPQAGSRSCHGSRGHETQSADQLSRSVDTNGPRPIPRRQKSLSKVPAETRRGSNNKNYL